MEGLVCRQVEIGLGKIYGDQGIFICWGKCSSLCRRLHNRTVRSNIFWRSYDLINEDHDAGEEKSEEVYGSHIKNVFVMDPWYIVYMGQYQL